MSQESEQETAQDAASTDQPEEISWETRAVELFLTIGFPFLIGFIAWGVIILAFYQWKIY